MALVFRRRSYSERVFLESEQLEALDAEPGHTCASSGSASSRAQTCGSSSLRTR